MSRLGPKGANGGDGPGFADRYAEELASMEIFGDQFSDIREIKFASVTGRRINIRPYDEWCSVDQDAGKVLTEKLGKRTWPLPGVPNVDESNPDLFREVIRASYPYLDFKDDRMDAVFAAWIIGSGIAEHFAVSPRLIINGIKGSGKTNVLKMINQLAYRGRNSGGSTAAVIYRVVDGYRVTYALDELQRCSQEARNGIMNVFNCGFDGSPIERYNSDKGDVDIFRTRGFMAVASKEMIFAEDELERAIYISMRKSKRNDIRVAPGPEEEESELMKVRGDLLGFWLRIRAGSESLADDRSRASEILNAPITLKDGTTIRLSGRTKSIADVLITIALHFNDDVAVEDILNVIAESKAQSDEELYETFNVQCFIALRDLVGSLPKRPMKVYLPDIRGRVNEILYATGNIESGKPITTKQVSKALKVMGFRPSAKGGAGGKSYIDFSLPYNLKVYADRLEEFASDESWGEGLAMA